MVDNKKDDGQEFNDDFDVDDFSDMDFDDTGLEEEGEFGDIAIDEDNFIDDDFENEDWDEEEELSAKKGKKEKSLYTDGEKKGLSFNTMAIIGALVVGGGIMVFNIMNATAEQKANQKSVFQSIMGMAGVMDGTIFGEANEEPTPEEIAEQQNQTLNEGFLNNPEAARPASVPQPAPIAPSAVNEPLTPMPPAENQMPRGPDDDAMGAPSDATAGSETVPVVPLADVPPSPEESTASTPSAEDILKKAMENREQKTQNKTMETTSSESALQEKPSDVDEPPPFAPVLMGEPIPTQDNKGPISDVVPLTPSPATEPARLATAPIEEPQAVKDMQAKMDELLKRVSELESELNTVRDAKSNDYVQIQENMVELRNDLQVLKDRPAAPAPAPKTSSTPKPAPAVEDDEDDTEQTPVAASPKPAPKKVVKPAAAPAPAVSANTRWELRAAQPGRAWVSKPGERDMKSVEVGETLAGIGKITAISYQGGRWIVYGTQGQIRQ